jgi:hypothetical protein
VPFERSLSSICAFRGVGVIGGYVYDHEKKRHDLAVRYSPTSEAGGVVEVDQVEVVGYHDGLTPDEVARILSDA